jgi:hypothetical protein
MLGYYNSVCVCSTPKAFASEIPCHRPPPRLVRSGIFVATRFL